jgi:hypothetical protein
VTLNNPAVEARTGSSALDISWAAQFYSFSTRSRRPLVRMERRIVMHY